MHDLPPSTSQEISQEQKDIFIQKAREKAPYSNEPIDNFGAYRVDYDHDETDVSIYIPSVSGEIDCDEEGLSMMSDGVAVLIRKEEPIDERYVLVHTRSYTIHLEDNSADYDERSRIFDVRDNQWATSLFPEGGMNNTKSLQDYLDTKSALGMGIFTEERFEEVCAVLNNLNVEDRY